MLLVDRFLATRIAVALGLVDPLSCAGISMTSLVQMKCQVVGFHVEDVTCKARRPPKIVAGEQEALRDAEKFLIPAKLTRDYRQAELVYIFSHELIQD